MLGQSIVSKEEGVRGEAKGQGSLILQAWLTGDSILREGIGRFPDRLCHGLV